MEKVYKKEKKKREVFAQAPSPLQPQWLKFELAKTASIWALGQ